MTFIGSVQVRQLISDDQEILARFDRSLLESYVEVRDHNIYSFHQALPNAIMEMACPSSRINTYCEDQARPEEEAFFQNSCIHTIDLACHADITCMLVCR